VLLLAVQMTAMLQFSATVCSFILGRADAENELFNNRPQFSSCSTIVRIAPSSYPLDRPLGKTRHRTQHLSLLD
jgi:hypothetical protein